MHVVVTYSLWSPVASSVPQGTRVVIAMSAGSSLPSSPVRATVRTKEAGRDYRVNMEVTHQPLGA